MEWYAIRNKRLARPKRTSFKTIEPTLTLADLSCDYICEYHAKTKEKRRLFAALPRGLLRPDPAGVNSMPFVLPAVKSPSTNEGEQRRPTPAASPRSFSFFARPPAAAPANVAPPSNTTPTAPSGEQPRESTAAPARQPAPKPAAVSGPPGSVLDPPAQRRHRFRRRSKLRRPRPSALRPPRGPPQRLEQRHRPKASASGRPRCAPLPRQREPTPISSARSSRRKLTS